jgi:hypothetical protein
MGGAMMGKNAAGGVPNWPRRPSQKINRVETRVAGKD